MATSQLKQIDESAVAEMIINEFARQTCFRVSASARAQGMTNSQGDAECGGKVLLFAELQVLVDCLQLTFVYGKVPK
jgi:hypothetical protein